MVFFYNMQRAWREARFVGLLLLLCSALGLRSCIGQEPPACPGVYSVIPALQAAVLPANTIYLAQQRRLGALRDTLLAGHGGSLQRKMLPQSRWRASGAYLVFPRPRRPKQAVLDSLAATARHSRHD